MAFEIQKSTERVNIYGTWYDIRQPTVKEAREISKQVKDKPEDDALGDMVSYVATLGVPKDVLESMETKHFLKLVTYLAEGSKKND